MKEEYRIYEFEGKYCVVHVKGESFNKVSKNMTHAEAILVACKLNDRLELREELERLKQEELTHSVAQEISFKLELLFAIEEEFTGYLKDV